MSNAIEYIPLGQIADFRNGMNFGKESRGKGCLLVGIPDFMGRFSPDYGLLAEINPEGIVKDDDYLQRGDIIFVRSNGNKALVGRSLFIDKDVKALFSGFCIRARITSEDFDKLFCAYFTKTATFKSQISSSSGTNINNLNQDILSQVKVPFLKKIEQQKIAAVLSALDAKIDCNNRINAELEALAKTLYDYWFVQFDFPFDFAQGRPSEGGKPYKSSGGKMVYNPTLKREIPAGWKDSTLADWIAADKTGDWGKEEAEGNYTLEVTCIRGADINGLNGNGRVNAPNRFILAKNDHKLLLPFDFVIEISGGSPSQSTGRIAWITDETLERFNNPLICSNFCKAISLKDNDLFFNFAYMWLSIYDSGVLFGWEGKTSGIKNLLFDAFISKYHVIKPPKDLAKRFFEFVAPFQATKQKFLLENNELTVLRDWLLPMLMNGQVRIKL